MKTDEKDQKYVWRWYVDRGTWKSGPYKTRKLLSNYINHYFDGSVSIVMQKSQVADLAAVVDDNFVDATLFSIITSVNEDYENLDPDLFFTERQQRDLAKKLKSAFAAWQSENGIAVPTGEIIETKNMGKVEAAE